MNEYTNVYRWNGNDDDDKSDEAVHKFDMISNNKGM